MIPVIENSAEKTAAASETYRLDFSSGRVRGRCAELEALSQAVHKILLTERCAFPIYGPDYGVELDKFFGRGEEFARASLENSLREAVCCDDRISGISDFELEAGDPGGIEASFKVLSFDGAAKTSLEVKI